jgi:hypothetical protein
MARIDDDIKRLTAERATFGETVSVTPLPSGARLIQVANYKLVPGWDLERVTILFVAPPAFPLAQPDCFWVEPAGLRFGGGRTPQNSNDQNPIPEVGPRGTWFSWHLQSWDPNTHTLSSYFRVVEKRLNPPR